MLTEEQKSIFLAEMKRFEQLKRNEPIRDPYVRLSRILPFTARQLCTYYRNYGNPKLCHDPLDEREKQFIINWISLYRRGKSISWMRLIKDLKSQFGLFRSENAVKNFYYSNQRSGAAETPALPSISFMLTFNFVEYTSLNLAPITDKQNPFALPTLQPDFKQDEIKLQTHI
ncbi:hypothetical protein C1645_809377 [Glomus cerebriforme]|uniref:HTH myb-type domain-containing protein n=1 Tax=Glomus cerebriforme TaxID=658196 RepID=A0A397SJT4_9GLOM|nr:hypothetical protein C1645_809377 [Glomus cerebriforme]